MTEKEWLTEQIRERLSFYQSITGVGFARKVQTEAAPRVPAVVAVPRPDAPRKRETLEAVEPIFVRIQLP